MADMLYSIEIPVPGLGQYFLCHCDTPESAAEVVRILVAQPAAAYDRVTVYIRPKDQQTRGAEYSAI